jgi:hypothetical protein
MTMTTRAVAVARLMGTRIADTSAGTITKPTRRGDQDRLAQGHQSRHRQDAPAPAEHA